MTENESDLEYWGRELRAYLKTHPRSFSVDDRTSESCDHLEVYADDDLTREQRADVITHLERAGFTISSTTRDAEIVVETPSHRLECAYSSTPGNNDLITDGGNDVHTNGPNTGDDGSIEEAPPLVQAVAASRDVHTLALKLPVDASGGDLEEVQETADKIRAAVQEVETLVKTHSGVQSKERVEYRYVRNVHYDKVEHSYAEDVKGVVFETDNELVTLSITDESMQAFLEAAEAVYHDIHGDMAEMRDIFTGRHPAVDQSGEEEGSQ